MKKAGGIIALVARIFAVIAGFTTLLFGALSCTNPTSGSNPTTYSISYLANGATAGTVPKDSNAYTSGQTVTVLGNNGSLVKTGYTFSGWNTKADGSGTSYAGGATFTMGSANIMLFAQWTTLPTYVVTYNANSATGGTVPTDSNAYTNGQTVTVIGNTGSLVRTGYTFSGWNTKADGSGTSYAGGATFTMGSANVTLYAQWTTLPTYVVTYNANGSTGGTVPTDSNAYTSGQTVTVLGNTGSLVKTGYTFSGWNTKADGSGTSYAGGATFTMGSANVTLYAQWTTLPTYIVTYNANGATGGTAPTDSNAYTSGQTVTVLGNTGSLVKTGYTFSGWNTKADGSGTLYAGGATFTMGSASLTLYAKWTASYTVTYNGNGSTGGTVPTDSNAYTSGQTVTVLGNTGSLTNGANKFYAWNTKTDGTGTTYSPGQSFTMGTSNIVLYALWTTSTTFTITYNGNSNTSGNPPTDSNIYLATQNATILDNTGSMALYGCTFQNWNTSPNGSGTTYSAGQVIQMPASNLTLYAHWNSTIFTFNIVNGSSYSVQANNNSISGNITIPPAWQGKPVASVANYGFQNCSKITSISMPNTITTISSYAFFQCSSLTSITLPNSLTSIGDDAFLFCSSLTSITLPNSLTSMGVAAFCGCRSLTSITLPNSVTSIGDAAFEDCSSLTSITLPNSLTSISAYAFYGCSSLTSITLPNSLTSISAYAFYDCSSLTSITLPNSVTSIGNGAFYGCSSLTSVTLPNLLTSIGYEAFYACTSLVTVIVNAVAPPQLDSTAFNSCNYLSAIKVPAGSVSSYQAATGWSSYASIIISQ